MKNRIRAVVAGFFIFAAASASAETFTVALKKPDRTPLPGHTVTFYLVAPHTVLDAKTTDSAGNVSFTDNAFVGQNRCVTVANQQGFLFNTTHEVDWPPESSFSFQGNLSCSGGFGPNFYFWGQRNPLGPKVTVYGGANGFVNPDRNETASIAFIAFISEIVTVRIYTSRGKLVATKTKAVVPLLQSEIVWDARNSEGQLVSSGIYIAKISGSGLNSTKKIAVVRN